MGLYAALLWPLNKEARKASTFATKIEAQLLSLPIDQRYDSGDIEHIYTIIKQVIGNSKNLALTEF